MGYERYLHKSVVGTGPRHFGHHVPMVLIFALETEEAEDNIRQSFIPGFMHTFNVSKFAAAFKHQNNVELLIKDIKSYGL